jgi:hypothetical protein
MNAETQKPVRDEAQRPVRENYPAQEERQAPPVTAPAGMPEPSHGDSPSASSWEQPMEHHEAWNPAPADTTPHEDTRGNIKSEPASKPELMQVETHPDTDNGNK